MPTSNAHIRLAAKQIALDRARHRAADPHCTCPDCILYHAEQQQTPAAPVARVGDAYRRANVTPKHLARLRAALGAVNEQLARVQRDDYRGTDINETPLLDAAQWLRDEIARRTGDVQRPTVEPDPRD